MLTTPRKHFDVSFPKSHCNVKQLMLISSCAVIERTVTRCDGKLKALIVTKNRADWSWKEEEFSEPNRKGEKWTILLAAGVESPAADSNLA